MSGPYATEREASREVMPRTVAALPVGEREAARLAWLTETCERAGVDLGAYDRRILGWLARWEPETCQVIGALIRRAADRQHKADG